MKMPKYCFPTPASQRGVTLIELMVGLIAGLLVSGAALSFVVASLRTNSETISATRLNQELRGVLDVVARDLRRARYTADPIANIGRGEANIVAPYDEVNITGSCLRFSYEDPEPFRAFYLRQTGGRGEIVFAAGAADGGCDAAGDPISSPEVDITAFQVVPQGTVVGPLCTRRVSLVLTGRLAAGPMADISRTFRTQIAMRSGALESCVSAPVVL